MTLSRDVYCMLDMGSTLYYVTPFVVVHVGFGLECIHDIFCVLTLMGDSVIAKKVYRGCVV